MAEEKRGAAMVGCWSVAVVQKQVSDYIVVAWVLVTELGRPKKGGGTTYPTSGWVSHQVVVSKLEAIRRVLPVSGPVHFARRHPSPFLLCILLTRVPGVRFLGSPQEAIR